ncbi:serine/threonine protein kinase, partial [Streptomyces nigra]
RRRPAAPRPGSARHRAATRRRRLALGGAAVVLVAAGVGTWLAVSDDDAGATPNDTRTTAPATP